MASGENCREDIGASKCWQRRAIENGKEEEAECSQVTEHRRNTVSATRCGILHEGVQPELNIPTSPDTFSGIVATFAVPDDGHGLGRGDVAPGSPVFFPRDGDEMLLYDLFSTTQFVAPAHSEIVAPRNSNPLLGSSESP